ncbi:MAG: hypothetical protein A2Z20_10705 [Bdellovibrionales bacterium RBG_16_40_8]|nr:MAG: hypothetical protein A2Z20_10705 [Bdellovibrionales bacterium RBG_16_40_8]
MSFDGGSENFSNIVQGLGGHRFMWAIVKMHVDAKRLVAIHQHPAHWIFDFKEYPTEPKSV